MNLVETRSTFTGSKVNEKYQSVLKNKPNTQNNNFYLLINCNLFEHPERFRKIFIAILKDFQYFFYFVKGSDRLFLLIFSII